MKVCNLDLEMIAKAKDLIDGYRFESNLEISEKNDLNFMAGYLEGLRYRIKSDLEAGGNHASSHI